MSQKRTAISHPRLRSNFFRPREGPRHRAVERFISVIIGSVTLLAGHRSGMRSLNESLAGLAAIRGTPRVATPHNLPFCLDVDSAAFFTGHRVTKQGEEISENLEAAFTSGSGNMILSGPARCLAGLLLAVGIVNSVSAVVKGNDYQHYQQQLPGDHFSKDLYRLESKNGLLGSYATFKTVTECMFVTSEPGTFVYTSKTDDDEVCGIYFLAGPDQKVEIEFRMLDVPCEHRGLISVVDGWELNGEVFPSEMDHRLPMKQRNVEFCGKNIAAKRTFTSSQNAAVIQYRIPKAAKGFTVTARFIKNFRPCNVLAASLTEPYTLRNYGRRINCTYVAFYPGTVQVIALSVGVSNFLSSVRTAETGTLRKCYETSPRDQLVIGGSYGLDTSKVQIVDSICGLDSKPDFRELVEYEVTSVRLESSGFFDNSATVQILPLI